MLSELATEAGLDPRVDKLTKANQAKMFNIYFKKFGPSVFADFEELPDKYKFLLNDIWELTKAKELDQEKGLKNPALIRPEAYDFMYNFGLYISPAKVPVLGGV